MKKVFMFLLSAFVLAACTPANIDSNSPVAEGTIPTLTVMTHDSFAVSEAVIAQFEQENNVQVEFLLSGDAGSMINQAILTQASPLADVIYGIDNTFLSRALEAGLFIPYRSPLLVDVPEEFIVDGGDSVTPVDYGDVCINYDVAYFSEHGLAIPQSLQDLTNPEYRGLLVVENPAVSSPGLAFLLATVNEYGDPGFMGFWQQMVENDVVVVNDWNTAYYTNFSGSSGHGEQPMVVSYGSSPAVEVVYASEPVTTAPTASLVGDRMCFRQVEFAGIVQGTQNQVLAEKFIDFMLSLPFQEDIPLQMFMYPVNQQAQLPDVFVTYNQVPLVPSTLPAIEISSNRDVWVQAWTEEVLR
ncbi:MAG TPA: thiamine ABC transporter substrate-binding protein [Longilinea sp.]|nr:thiamine ABC transporter substrate-binding protein [Longilinea sp.]